jgi:hypothetical protein
MSESVNNTAGVAAYLSANWPADQLPTDYQASCYIERYPDVIQKINGTDLSQAKMHWLTSGIEEGRTMTCNLGRNSGMTNEQAKCFRRRYPNL